ncbi:unnamed protein product [Urochloa humidicola]
MVAGRTPFRDHWLIMEELADFTSTKLKECLICVQKLHANHTSILSSSCGCGRGSEGQQLDIHVVSSVILDGL